jgi:hypothetical protein
MSASWGRQVGTYSTCVATHSATAWRDGSFISTALILTAASFGWDLTLHFFSSAVTHLPDKASNLAEWIRLIMIRTSQQQCFVLPEINTHACVTCLLTRQQWP